MRAPLPVLLLAATVLGAPLPGGAQWLPAPASPLAQGNADSARDSARALRSARSAQVQFERVRFQHLPWTEERGGGECDERIGRFCIWYGEDGEEWTPPPEPEPVVRARETLLRRLEEAAVLAPGDEWIAGQRVRYLVEAKRFGEVAAAAEGCRAGGWWCLALQGMAHHAAGEAEQADAAFDAALARMPERDRREWTDLSVLLGNDGVGAYRRMPPAERARIETLYWWLADPFWMLPGNPRRAEHLSRWVTDRLQDRARNPDGIVWADDLREILLRFGAPIGWERIRPRIHEMGRPSVVTHYGPSRLSAPPPFAALRDPLTLRVEDWPREERSSRVDFDRGFSSLEHQVAVFRRGDSAVVVAGYTLDPDSVPASMEVEAGLVLMPGPEATPVLERRTRTGPAGALRVTAPFAPTVLSLEARADSGKRVGRARYGVRLSAPSGGIALSDVLLLDVPDPLPTELEEAAPRARGSTRVRPGESLGLFWEVYGLPERPDTVAFAVSVRRSGTGWGRRMAERLGLVGEETPIRVRWDEETPGEATLARTLVLAIPQLPRGEYTLELSVIPRAGEPVTATRSLRVEPR
ncbi:MAG TPA: hypothetical protein VHG28_24390 [Longimicrobiaceae bacterium]|nr:hypothetical protein [Longimicrobiaceae bacterium]